MKGLSAGLVSVKDRVSAITLAPVADFRRIADPAAWVDAARWVSAIACARPRFEGGIHMPSKSNSDFYQIAETLNAHELAASAAILLSAISNNRPAKTIPWAGSARCQDRNRH